MSRQQTWAIEDHLCRYCGGRILRCVKGNGPTGGGNPLYRCASCGRTAAATGPESLCFCGLSLHQCLAYSAIKKYPRLRSALVPGCDPSYGEVGFAVREAVRKAMEEAKA